jgi:hypothetical protein
MYGCMYVWIWFRLGRWTVGTESLLLLLLLLLRWPNGVFVSGLLLLRVVNVGVDVHVDMLEGNSRS